MKSWLVVCLLLWAGVIEAADTLVITKSGYYLLSADSAGVPTLRKITSVLKLDEPAPGPVDPVPPNPTVFDAHRTAVQVATDRVATHPNKENVKKALAELYRTMAGLPVTTPSQLQQATNVMFGALNLPLWAEWKVAVDKSLAGFTAIDDAKKAWAMVAEVLEKPVAREGR